MLQNCSCSGLEAGLHSRLCLLSAVRHRTSLICKPFPQEREHALHSVVNHCGRHSPMSHSCTGAGLSRSEHAEESTTLKSLPVFWTQMMSRRCVPLPHLTLHCVQGLVYHMVTAAQGPPLQAFISAGLSATQLSSPPSPSFTSPRVKHTTSLFCTPGPH